MLIGLAANHGGGEHRLGADATGRDRDVGVGDGIVVLVGDLDAHRAAVASHDHAERGVPHGASHVQRFVENAAVVIGDVFEIEAGGKTSHLQREGAQDQSGE